MSEEYTESVTDINECWFIDQLMRAGSKPYHGEVRFAATPGGIVRITWLYQQLELRCMMRGRDHIRRVVVVDNPSYPAALKLARAVTDDLWEELLEGAQKVILADLAGIFNK